MIGKSAAAYPADKGPPAGYEYIAVFRFSLINGDLRLRQLRVYRLRLEHEVGALRGLRVLIGEYAVYNIGKKRRRRADNQFGDAHTYAAGAGAGAGAVVEAGGVGTIAALRSAIALNTALKSTVTGDA